MTLNNFLLFFILVIYTTVGIYVSKYVKGSADYYIMGEKAPTFFVVGDLAATYISVVTLAAGAGICYQQGPLVLVASAAFGAWFGTLFGVLYIGRKFKALGCYTLPDFFQKRFSNNMVSIVATLIMIVALMGYGIAQMMGAGLLLSDITGISFPHIIIIFTVALFFFSVPGGMWGVVITDALMFLTICIITFIICPIIFYKAGWTTLTMDLPQHLPHFWTLGGTNQLPLGWTLSQFVIWMLFFACYPAMISRIFPAKDEFVVIKSGIIGVFLISAMVTMIYFAAGAMQAIAPNISPPDKVMIYAFTHVVPKGLGAFGIAGIMSAIMSTTATMFVLAGFSLSRDLYEKIINKPFSEKQRLLHGRIGQAVIAILVGIITISRPPAIFRYSLYSGSFFAVCWLPVVIAGMEWKRMNSKAALGCMIIGAISITGIPMMVDYGIISLPRHLDPLMLSILISVTALIILGLISNPEKKELEYFYKIKNSRLSDRTIAQAKMHPQGMQKLVKSYYETKRVGFAVLVIAILFWGFFIIKLGLPLLPSG